MKNGISNACCFVGSELSKSLLLLRICYLTEQQVHRRLY